jgi:hypothetical protein
MTGFPVSLRNLLLFHCTRFDAVADRVQLGPNGRKPNVENGRKQGYDVVTVAKYPCALASKVEQLGSVLQVVHTVELVQIFTVVVIFAVVRNPAEFLIWVTASE